MTRCRSPTCGCWRRCCRARSSRSGATTPSTRRRWAARPTSPTPPVVFLKPSTSVIGPGDADRSTRSASRSEVDYEGELAVVIARLCREVPPERVAGRRPGLHLRQRRHRPRPAEARVAVGPGQGLRHVLPARPVDRDRRSTRADLARHHHRQRRAAAGRPHVADDARHRRARVAHVSQAMTLLPGDVILTGTPAGVGPLAVGDEVSVTIEGSAP